MCEHRTLSHSDTGYIIHCIKCNHYQLAFGTTVLCLSGQQYAEFKQEVSIQHEQYESYAFPGQKIVRLSIFAPHAVMALSTHELGGLVEMVREASLMEEVGRILHTL